MSHERLYYPGSNSLSRFVNLTPHVIRLAQLPESENQPLNIVSIPPSGITVRVTEGPTRYLGLRGNVPTYSPPEMGVVEDLPPEEEGTYYIVSRLCVGKVGNRTDCFCPDTGPTAVRDERGNIDYVTRLIEC